MTIPPLGVKEANQPQDEKLPEVVLFCFVLTPMSFLPALVRVQAKALANWI